MIKYKKIISIAMSMLIMSTAFSTNVFACCNNKKINTVPIARYTDDVEEP